MVWRNMSSTGWAFEHLVPSWWQAAGEDDGTFERRSFVEGSASVRVGFVVLESDPLPVSLFPVPEWNVISLLPGFRGDFCYCWHDFPTRMDCIPWGPHANNPSYPKWLLVRVFYDSVRKVANTDAILYLILSPSNRYRCLVLAILRLRLKITRQILKSWIY